MSSAHVPRHVNKSLRLAALLRRFEVSKELMRSQDAKLIQAAVKSQYLKQAKKQHPDLASDQHKDLAVQRFKVLGEEYEEASAMLKDGVRPVAPGVTTRTEGNQYMTRPVSGVYPEDFEPGPRYPVHKDVEMDASTRALIWAKVGLGVVVFITCVREVLVYTAGRGGKWYGATDLNPFNIRRYDKDWKAVAKQDREFPPEKTAGTKEAAVREETEKKVKELKSKKDRGTDSFYLNRGISNKPSYGKVASAWVPKLGEKVCMASTGFEANFIGPGAKKGSWMLWILDRGHEGRARVDIHDVKPFDRGLGKCHQPEIRPPA